MVIGHSVGSVDLSMQQILEKAETTVRTASASRPNALRKITDCTPGGTYKDVMRSRSSKIDAGTAFYNINFESHASQKMTTGTSPKFDSGICQKRKVNKCKNKLLHASLPGCLVQYSRSRRALAQGGREGKQSRRKRDCSEESSRGRHDTINTGRGGEWTENWIGNAIKIQTDIRIIMIKNYLNSRNLETLKRFSAFLKIWEN